MEVLNQLTTDFFAFVQMTPLTLMHILGVAFGLGIATGMDFLLGRLVFRNNTLTTTHYQSIKILSKFVAAALVMLWISGIGFLAYYYFFSPEKLSNPKIWSKLMIVSVLTANGWAIHHWVLPKLKTCVGKTLMSALPYKTLALFFATGAISFVSWYIPFFYGTVPQLNFAFSMAEFTAAYLSILSVAILSGLAVLGFLYASQPAKRKNNGNRLLVEKKSKPEFYDSYPDNVVSAKFESMTTAR